MLSKITQFLCLTILCASTSALALSLSDYNNKNSACFNRDLEPDIMVADSHLHFRPFSGPAINFNDLMAQIKSQGVLFVSVYGVGQTFRYDVSKADRQCKDCKENVIYPSIHNDYANAEIALDNGVIPEQKNQDIKLTFAMSGFDLTQPDLLSDLLSRYEKDFPHLFKLAAELNVAKQGFLDHKVYPVTLEQIDRWKPFMLRLQESHKAIGLHSDLGNDINNTEYLPLVEKTLKDYPNNRIIWMHLGMSPELSNMSAEKHIKILRQLMEQYPNLTLDISWGKVLKPQFKKNLKKYVRFLNHYSKRIITGSDYVGYKNKTNYNYRQQLKLSSYINQYLSDRAFRDIALGQSYLNLLGLDQRYQAPQVCKK